jgi:hypothetical protein
MCCLHTKIREGGGIMVEHQLKMWKKFKNAKPSLIDWHLKSIIQIKIRNPNVSTVQMIVLKFAMNLQRVWPIYWFFFPLTDRMAWHCLESNISHFLMLSRYAVGSQLDLLKFNKLSCFSYLLKPFDTNIKFCRT